MKDLVYKSGCIIEAGKSGDINVLFQQNNCFCTRKSGIAPLIDKAFGVGKVDNNTIRGDKNKIGHYVEELSTQFNVENQIATQVMVVFMYGQYYYGKDKKQYTDYNAVHNALVSYSYANLCKNHSLKIGIPYGIGCGLGGGDWNIIEQIIKDTLCRYDYSVTIYKLEGVK